MAESTNEPGPCGVRRGTGDPCPRPAAVEIWGVPFCERCARQQEAYFAIGELTQEEEDLPRLRRGGVRACRDEQLAEVLGGMRRERARSTAGTKGPEEAKAPIRGAA